MGTHCPISAQGFQFHQTEHKHFIPGINLTWQWSIIMFTHYWIQVEMPHMQKDMWEWKQRQNLSSREVCAGHHIMGAI